MSTYSEVYICIKGELEPVWTALMGFRLTYPQAQLALERISIERLPNHHLVIVFHDGEIKWYEHYPHVQALCHLWEHLKNSFMADDGDLEFSGVFLQLGSGADDPCEDRFGDFSGDLGGFETSISRDYSPCEPERDYRQSIPD